uniref:Uncharacterized protein n=1 Tax=Siphoviridae sp. ct4Ap70 TaxID=2825328 RepID=A0A8S5NWG4_9CAUD|nr:MAG TPA: hypothetical protein [Siphoviridae sp. ct4Ap70]
MLHQFVLLHFLLTLSYSYSFNSFHSQLIFLFFN